MRKRSKRRPYVATQRKLATCPWKITAVFQPLEAIFRQIERTGQIDSAQGRPVFYEDGNGGWYEMVPELRGVIEFHALAQARHGLPVDLDPLAKLANKLDHGTPLFEADLAAARVCIDSCKRQALKLTLDEAQDIVDTVRIRTEIERAGLSDTTRLEKP